MPLRTRPTSIDSSPIALADRVYDIMRNAIIVGDLAGGEPVRETEVAEILGVSRTPVREAFRRLAANGLIVIEVNRGSRVVPIEPRSLTETSGVIAELCGLAAKLATPRLTVEDEEFYVAMELDLFGRVIRGEPREQTSQASETINRLVERAGNTAIRDAIAVRRPHMERLFHRYSALIPLLPMAERVAAIASAVRVKDAELLSVTIRSFYEHIAADLIRFATEDLANSADASAAIG